MYPAERRQEIVKLLSRDERVNIAELAAYFGVSRASVRRDLNYLHRKGFLQRTYGGALRVTLTKGRSEAPFSERQVIHEEEKRRIGEFAAQLVEPGETIFIDGGTTTECMVSHLVKQPCLTVVTFGLNIANRLIGYENITVILVGGTLHHSSLTLVGILALESIQAYKMHFHKAFIAAGGVSAKWGITNADFEQIPMKRKAIETSAQAILLADSSKVGVVAAGQVCPAEKIHRLVTDVKAPLDEIDKIRELGIVVDLV
jgi:DeoR/GlpR family transcriptional regulator of sugar metabolism